MSEIAGKPSSIEVPSQTYFNRMQEFLREKGELVMRTDPTTGEQVQERRYSRQNLFFKVIHLSLDFLGGNKDDKNYRTDLTISQAQLLSPESAAPDIEITFDPPNQPVQEEKNAGFREVSVEERTRIVLVNPQSGKREKATITPFAPIGRWLGLNKERWHEAKSKSKSHATTSDDEVKKIVESLLQTDEGTQIGATTIVTSRRDLLRFGTKLAALDILLAHIPVGLPSLSRGFWEQLESATIGVSPEELRKEVEARFNIEIVSPSTGVREVKYSPKDKITTIEWGSPTLKMLIGTLAELPNHFYAPKNVGEEEERVQVALVDQPAISLKGINLGIKSFCDCFNYHAMVVFDKKMLGTTFLKSPLSSEVVHEFTHVVTTPEIDRYVQSIAEPIGLGNLIELRKNFSSIIMLIGKESVPGEFYPTRNWAKSSVPPTTDTFLTFDKDNLPFDWDRRDLDIEKEGEDYFFKERKGGGIWKFVRVAPDWYVSKEEFDRLGEDFFKKQYDDYIEKVRDWDEYSGRVIGLPIPPDVSNLGYGANNFKEFFSVAASFYIRGHNSFVGTYEPYLGKERAEKLYEGMKREIFRGKEYGLMA